MDDDGKKPEDEPPEPARDAAQDEGAKLRVVSEDELKQILEASKTWLETGGEEGKKANLSRTNLWGASLSGADLVGANLRGAKLSCANLGRADLTGADLAGADLWGANLTAATLTAANLKGAYLRGAKLQEASLANARLQGADFTDANLKSANLPDANLQGAGLRDANLQGADLIGANLQGSDLIGANLQGAGLTNATFERRVATEGGEPAEDLEAANLTGANFRDADLSDAKLSDVTGLLADMLAGANLSNAKLPEKIATFERLQQVEETSKNARKIFLSMLLGCGYAWLTIATTTDARLLTNSASSPLPIIGTEIPIAGFYWVAPILLLGVYLYLHFYLQRMWEGLGALPARFQDGEALHEKAYPWLLIGLVRANFLRLREDRTALSRLESLASIFLAWWVLPLTVAGFWARYLPRHEWFGTGLHVVLLIISIGSAILLHGHATATLRRDVTAFDRRKPWRDRRTYQGAVTVGLGAVFALVSLGAIEGDVRRSEYAESIVNMPDAVTLESNTWESDVATWVSYAFDRIGYRTYADLRESEVSTKPATWTGLAERRLKELEMVDGALVERARTELGQVKGARLEGADLHHAEAFGAFLAKADLRDANLQGADLRNADLQGADLRNADLRGANLTRANLQGANLESANFQWAILIEANLQEARLVAVPFQRAKLFRANLQGARLWISNLQRASLGGANLQEADLRGANLRGANLAGANLQRASLIANLFGASLFHANLQGAKLHGTGLGNTKIMQGGINIIDLAVADLSDAQNVTREQLDEACGDDETRLPDYLGDYQMKPCPEPEQPPSN